MVHEDFILNQEQDLANRIPHVLKARKDLGLSGFVEGLDSVIICTEPERLFPAVAELLRRTGFGIEACFEDEWYTTFVLGMRNSASLIVRARKKGNNPFRTVNWAARTRNWPDTRPETFVFRTRNLEQYASVQAEQGVRFMEPGIIDHPSYRFLQTIPSRYTGNSLGFIEWTGREGDYRPVNAPNLPVVLEKPSLPHLAFIQGLDHTATRVRALDRNEAIIEFMALTEYSFDFAVFVKSQNSITSVARLPDETFAMVFTSGIEPFREDTDPGPTEMFIQNYGTRVHHMAFQTDFIDDTFDALKGDGVEFLVELVGSETDGLKQTFTVPSPHTMLVTEYIHRYEGFDGFFTRSNVEKLTRATAKQ